MPTEADREGGKNRNRNPCVATGRLMRGGADRCAQLAYLHIDVQGRKISKN